MKFPKNGFTMIELVLALVVGALVAAAVIPAVTDYISNVQDEYADSVIQTVRAGLIDYFNEEMSTNGHGNSPTSLGGTLPNVCSDANPCFGNVLDEPITDSNWQVQGDGNYYLYIPTNTQYFYSQGSPGEVGTITKL